ncbi:MAG: hypothetical protein HY460_00725 [Parcubacteria group bacterium]|nr:hypothetical protein [Parcubacteria group bacterium]
MQPSTLPRGIARTGFTLVEMLIYMTVLVLMVTLVVNFLLTFMRNYSTARLRRAMEDNLTSAMEVMAREIRQSRSIYYPTSCFSPLQPGAPVSCEALLGQLSVETARNLPLFASELSSTETRTYVDYFVSDGILLRKREGSVLPLALTSDDITVTRLEFLDYSTAKNHAVGIEMEIQGKNILQKSTLRTHAVLREFTP